jgi:GTPase SAR1 family protein
VLWFAGFFSLFFFFFFFPFFFPYPKHGQKFQISVHGREEAGKSALVLRLKQREFVECFDPTVEEFYDVVLEETPVTLFDTVPWGSSSPCYPLTKEKVMEASAAFVYCVSSVEEESVIKKDFDQFLRIVRRYWGGGEKLAEVPVVIAVTKSDLKKINRSDLRRIFQDLRIVSCSAKKGDNVAQVFHEALWLARGEGPLRREMNSLCQFVCLFVCWYLKDTGIVKDIRKMIVEYVWASRNEVEVWKRAVRLKQQKCVLQ